MFHIIIHCKPKEGNEEYFGKVADASILIDYKDYSGALELSKFYIKENGWEFIKLAEEYYTFEKKEDLPKDYQKYFKELKKFGYSIIFNLYNKETMELYIGMAHIQNTDETILGGAKGATVNMLCLANSKEDYEGKIQQYISSETDFILLELEDVKIFNFDVKSKRLRNKAKEALKSSIPIFDTFYTYKE